MFQELEESGMIRIYPWSPITLCKLEQKLHIYSLKFDVFPESLFFGFHDE